LHVLGLENAVTFFGHSPQASSQHIST